MNQDDTLWSLEERLWTSGRDSARTMMASGAIVVLPYPDGILQGDGLWSHPAVNTGWRLVEMSNRTVARQGNVAVLAYRVRATKPDVPEYEALCASTWLSDEGTWRRLFHQQTPVA
ncbi:nuclear transport factor 2 family protein [Cereibacter sphaeroides]|uniref:nuclear transport factor 2 family protein n=1 Tax=Cereibacter sphaeroides TaxID=1063 RepID=UPI001F3054EF|nr:nuclear transport factor 2 family protein [Cereibacter sphaeroides]MCE6959886.1 nuclear transport factor 2 family protein [Cereibacter sphaeroides]MCE6968455.1 nuclear transport factor 2 family protein [Cereibacter sphaeroides]MCE6972971.1 nuclear transport factor 2 family protein [Cereibacter sphaeroides]